MKYLVTILITITFISCKNSKKFDNNKKKDLEVKKVSLIEINELPITLSWKSFFSFDSYHRIMINRDTIWKINTDYNFYIILSNQKSIARPKLYTYNMNNHNIDSVDIFDRECYIGTDSHYSPTLIITKDLDVIWKDTSTYISVISQGDKYIEYGNVEEISSNKISINHNGVIITAPNI